MVNDLNYLSPYIVKYHQDKTRGKQARALDGNFVYLRLGRGGPKSLEKPQS